MGIADIRAAFNQAAGDAYTCSYAYHRYTRTANGERQMLQFTGTDASGAKFDIEANDLPPGADLQEMAAQTARRLLDQGIQTP